MLWSDFKTAVKIDLPVDNDRIGIATGTPNFVDQNILHGVVNLQKYVEFYRGWHETVYGPADVVVEGKANIGSIPQGQQCRPQDAFFKKIGKQCVSQPFGMYDWGNRYDLICGNPRIINCQFLMAIDPQSSQFITYPPLRNNNQISFFWEGVKTSFLDTDDTPFDTDAAEAIALFVKARIARQVDHDLAEYASYMQEFSVKQRLLFADTRDRKRLALTGTSPYAINGCANSISPCVDAGGTCADPNRQNEDTVSFCAFGDSSDADMTNTNYVATLVKSLEPDFVLHLGDCNYPNGDPVTIQDNLVKPYGLYIPKKFYLSFGNHDTATDGGAALSALLTTQTGLNGGKPYYDFIAGRTNHEFAHIFVLNGNDPNGVLDGSEQWLWLEPILASSDLWNVIAVHQPFLTSDINHYPGNPAFQRDWKSTNAHLMICGHGHNYERITYNGFPLIVCGLGGAPARGFHSPPVAGSQFRYNAFYGSLYITARPTRLQTTFYDTRGEVIDSLVLEKQLALVP